MVERIGTSNIIRVNENQAVLQKGVPYNVLVDNECIRKLHPIECERLQTVPDNYTSGVSNTLGATIC